MDEIAQPAPAPQVPPPGPKPVWKDKKFLIPIGILSILIVFTLSFLLFSRGSKEITPPKPEEPSPETWEITLNYNSETKNLSLKKLALAGKSFRPDTRSDQDSPYKLSVLDKSNSIIYQSGIHITERVIFNVSDVNELKGFVQPAEFDTIVYVPYFFNASKLVITKNSTPVLHISLDQNSATPVSFDLIPEALAQSASSCGPMQIVFISDAYTNFAQFQSDVDRIKSAFNATQPYASYASQIFDFKTINNSENLGCTSGIVPDPQRGRFTGCIENPRIKQIGLAQFPTASKFIVLVNNPNAALVDGGIYGVANDIGGDLGIFTNRTDIPTIEFTKTAVHEVLGHLVGKLYDRYLYPFPFPLISSIKSNCSNNSSGEPFWRQSGASGAYQGCQDSSAYAPFPRNCGNNGNNSTIMSAASCSASGFDSVESAWISTQIIPRYQNSCSTPTPTPVPINPIPTIPTNDPVVIPPPPTDNGGTIQYTLPVVQTQNPTELKSTSVIANGQVISVEGGYIRIRGFEYFDTSIADNQKYRTARPGTYPETDTHKYVYEGPGNYEVTSYNINLSGLLPKHTYAIRAYAVNDNSIRGFDVSLAGWGEWIEFTTPEQLGETPASVTITPPANTSGGSEASIKNLRCTLSPNTQVYTCQ